MGFRPFEISRTRGAPVELFRFRYGVLETDAFCYTNGEKEIEHQGLTYWPIPIKRGKIASSSEDSGKTSLDITLPGNALVADLFRVTAPPGNIGVTIFQGHSRDPEAEFIAIWVGRVTACNWEDNTNLAKFICEPIRSQLRRLSLRRHYQYMCPHVLYGAQCRASEAAATQQRTVLAVSGRLVTIAGAVETPDNLLGGMLKWVDSNSITRARTILGWEAVEGGVRLSLSGADDGIKPGMPVSCVRGCSHTIDGCLTHNNVSNFGGQPFIPVTSPLGVNGAFS